MNRRWMAIAVFLAMLGFGSPFALAQPAVFFDDFDGNELLPHWNVPSPSCWTYNVSNSMLNVTGLHCPSHPKSPNNIAAIGASFAPQTDFRADAWMGWEAGDQPHRLVLRVSGPTGGILAEFGYRHEAWAGANPLIFASASGQLVNMPAPAPGMYHFTITRTGTQVDFLLNGTPVASFSGALTFSAGRVGFEFVGPYPGELGVFRIDRVQVVPAPSTLILISALVLGHARRRK
jgi:hypothetical protein